MTTAQFTSGEIDTARLRLADLYDRDPAIRALAAGPMRSCGLFVLYRNMDGKTLLTRAWADAVEAINRIADVYGKGVRPRTPQIDSMSFDLRYAPEFWVRLHGFSMSSMSQT